MSINLQLPTLTELRPRIKVIGVGGAGGNAVNNMIAAGLTGVEYVAANTDAQALAHSGAERKLQLGITLTEGLGAGSRPEIGLAAAEEALEDIRRELRGSHMVFVAAGMGGGTGTGAAAVIARAAREMDILTVGIVTKPFHFEGARRMRVADAGIAELKSAVDTLIVIPNQNLFRVASEKTTFADAFVLADQVLYSGIACIVDLIMKDGLINLDLADVRTVLKDMGAAMMGTGEATGEGRAVRAAEDAITNPLIEDLTLSGAKGLLLSIIGGRGMTLFDVEGAASRVRQEVDPDANIIVGAAFDEAMGDKIRVSIVASGLPQQAVQRDRPAGRTAPPPPPAGAAAAKRPPAAPAPAPGAAPAPPQARPAAGQPKAAPPKLPAQAGPAGPAPRGFDPEALNPHAQRPGAARPPAAAPAKANEPAWRAPGGVVIEEARPGPGGNPQAKAAPPATGAPAPAAFSPAPPADGRHDLRGVPGVEAFSPIAQREHAAKTNAAPGPAQPAGAGGLLQRLVDNGFVRGGAGNPPSAPNHHNATTPPPISQPTKTYPQTSDRPAAAVKK